MALRSIQEQGCKSPCRSCEHTVECAEMRSHIADPDMSFCKNLLTFKFASVRFDQSNLFVGSTTARAEIHAEPPSRRQTAQGSVV